MTRRGRKPLALEHVRQLEGSQHAKQRMTTLLMTLQGTCTIDQARARLNLSESQFHAVRQRWLQGAVQLLEPRAPGRRRCTADASSQRIAELEEEIRSLQRELSMAHAACQVQQILAGEKKGATAS